MLRLLLLLFQQLQYLLVVLCGSICSRPVVALCFWCQAGILRQSAAVENM